MANDILAQANSSTPSLDSVVVSISQFVERDYKERNVFPELRSSKAIRFQGNSSIHFLSTDQAEAVLADAQVRVEANSRSVKPAYKALIEALPKLIANAKNRPSIFGAKVAVRIKESIYGERWRGTKQQLLELGIHLDKPWPGEPGGRIQFQRARDRHGRKATIRRHSDIWPGIYEVEIYASAETPETSDVQPQNTPCNSNNWRERLTEMQQGFLMAMELDIEECKRKLAMDDQNLARTVRGELVAKQIRTLANIDEYRVKHGGPLSHSFPKHLTLAWSASK